MNKTCAIIGGGVIGGGWAARFLLNGWDVNISDPDPESERKISAVLENARRSLPGLSDVAMPDEGQLAGMATCPTVCSLWENHSIGRYGYLPYEVCRGLEARRKMLCPRKLEKENPRKDSTA